MEEIPQKFWWVFWSVAIATTLYCLIQLNTEHRRYPLKYRLVWSMVVFMPFFGPLLYGGLFRRLDPTKHGVESYGGGWGLDGDHRGSTDFNGSESGGGDAGGGD